MVRRSNKTKTHPFIHLPAGLPTIFVAHQPQRTFYHQSVAVKIGPSHAPCACDHQSDQKLGRTAICGRLHPKESECGGTDTHDDRVVLTYSVTHLFGTVSMSWAKDLFGISSDDEEGDIAALHDMRTAMLLPPGV